MIAIKRHTTIIAVLFASVLFSCQKTQINSNIKPIILGHGGMGEKSLSYPMNSEEGISKCLQSEAHGSEIDIQLTKDSLLVCYHDEDLNGKLDCVEGIVNQYSWSEISNCNYKVFSGKKKTLSLLTDVLNDNKQTTKKTISLDCKFVSGETFSVYLPIFERAISKILKEYETNYTFFVEGRDTAFLKNIKLKSPNTKCFILVSTKQDYEYSCLKQNLIDGYSIDVNAISKAEVNEIQQNQLSVMVWGCSKKEDNKKALEIAANTIQTDDLDYLLKE